MIAEYLDRGSLVARMEYYKEHTAEESGEHYAYSVALREIRNAPAADVAPVVRCKDCVHARKKNDYESAYLCYGILICTNCEVGEDGWLPVWPQHFCSYGRQKGDASDEV